MGGCTGRMRTGNERRSLAEARAARKGALACRPRLPRLWLVSDPARLSDPAPVLARLPRGCGLIWRPYGLRRAQALAVGRRLRALTRRRGHLLLVAGDWRLATRLSADGLHLPEALARRGPLAPALGWRRAHRGAARPWLSAACHGRRALARATALGADMVTLSPVFATDSHPGAPNLGPLRFAALTRRAGRPVIALGGLTARRLRRLPPGATAGVAMIGALAGDPMGVSRAARALYRGG